MSTPTTKDLHFVTPNDDGRLATSNSLVFLKLSREYEVKYMLAEELRAILNPRDCEYTLTVDTPRGKYVFKVTNDRVLKCFETDNSTIRWSPADVFTLFYTAKTLTITDLVDLRKSKKGRAVMEDEGELLVHDDQGKDSCVPFRRTTRYKIPLMPLWVIRALERPLDCGYSAVLEGSGSSREVTIMPNTHPSIIGLHNYDFMTITDIWNEEDK